MNRILATVLASLGLSLTPLASDATVVLSFDGPDPDMKLSAAFTITGDTLTLMLRNESEPSGSKRDLLTSFYFDIVDDSGNRPTLTYLSAIGDVYQGDRNDPDPLETADKDLVADSEGDGTWQFKQGLELLTGATTLSFGVGTAGSHKYKHGESANGFDKDIVHRTEYGIYSGDVLTCELDGKSLVKTSATFSFSGLAGFTEADIAEVALFGLGKKPHKATLASTGVAVPEATNGLLLAIGLGGLALAGRRRS
jgi:hypothetical protein